VRPFSEWPRPLRRALAGFEVVVRNGDGKGQTDIVQKLRFHDKPKALELMCKHLALFVERREVGRPGEFATLTDDELASRILAAARQVAERSRRVAER
jgi:hypothetical protein